MKKGLNVLFISNSTSFYYRNALYNMLSEAGYEDSKLCLCYYSGCSLQQHHDWWLNGEGNYEFYIESKDGSEVKKNYSMAEAMEYLDWDVISIDNNSASFATGEHDICLQNSEPYFKVVLEKAKALHPNSKFYWLQTWANEIGYAMSYKMETKEQRDKISLANKTVSKALSEKYGVGIVPAAEAWDKVRDNPIITQLFEGCELDRVTLTSRTYKDRMLDDFTHDGDIGGGQYLNACVWYEILTGLDCRKLSYRQKCIFKDKDLSLSEEKTVLLQNAAHGAVEEWK